ncbi:MAG: hypothetical protein R6T96_14035 [Longimicrobiales bacterium]
MKDSLIIMPEYTFKGYTRVIADIENGSKVHRSMLIEQKDSEVLVLFYEETPSSDPRWTIATDTIEGYLALLEEISWLGNNVSNKSKKWLKHHLNRENIDWDYFKKL